MTLPSPTRNGRFIGAAAIIARRHSRALWAAFAPAATCRPAATSNPASIAITPFGSIFSSTSSLAPA
jgi:hypothetical protein